MLPVDNEDAREIGRDVESRNFDDLTDVCLARGLEKVAAAGWSDNKEEDGTFESAAGDGEEGTERDTGLSVDEEGDGCAGRSGEGDEEGNGNGEGEVDEVCNRASAGAAAETEKG